MNTTMLASTAKKKRTRYFYPVGLLSLAVLPLVLVWHVTDTESAKRKGALEVYLVPSEVLWVSGAVGPFTLGPNGHWKVFQLPKERASERTVLDSLEAAIKLHSAQYDTVNGIRVGFQKETAYGTFAHLIDVLELQGMSRYVVEGADLWIGNQPPRSLTSRSQANPFISDYVRVVRLNLNEAPARQFQRLLEGYAFLINPSHRSVVGTVALAWIVITLLNAYRLRRLYRETHIR